MLTSSATETSLIDGENIINNIFTVWFHQQFVIKWDCCCHSYLAQFWLLQLQQKIQEPKCRHHIALVTEKILPWSSWILLSVAQVAGSFFWRHFQKLQLERAIQFCCATRLHRWVWSFLATLVVLWHFVTKRIVQSEIWLMMEPSMHLRLLLWKSLVDWMHGSMSWKMGACWDVFQKHNRLEELGKNHFRHTILPPKDVLYFLGAQYPGLVRRAQCNWYNAWLMPNLTAEMMTETLSNVDPKLEVELNRIVSCLVFFQLDI